MSPETALKRWFSAATIEPLGAGHIHDTFLVTTDQGRWVLQRVNQAVFVDPDLVMRQTARLLDHWQQQSHYTVPQLLAGTDGQVGQWVDGEYWRLWSYLAATTVVDPVEHVRQARAAGAAFARLQSHLANLPGPRFVDPIEGFLQLDKYLAVYDTVAAKAPGDLDQIISAHRGLAQRFAQRNAYIHGDCKVNNLLFDAQAERVAAIIDFDTAMWGHWAWDFGDLVRSVSFSSGAVQAQDFAACLEGFVAHQPLTNKADCLAAPAYVTLMLAVRFLTDHLFGDVYFRVNQRGENLERAQQQFALLAQFAQLAPELEDVAGDVFSRYPSRGID